MDSRTGSVGAAAKAREREPTLAERAGVLALAACGLVATACSRESGSDTQFRFERNGEGYILYAAVKPDSARARFCFLTLDVSAKDRDALIGAASTETVNAAAFEAILKDKLDKRAVTLLNAKGLGLLHLSRKLTEHKEKDAFGWSTEESAKEFLRAIVTANQHETVDKEGEQSKQSDTEALVVRRRKAFEDVVKVQGQTGSDVDAPITCALRQETTNADGKKETSTVTPAQPGTCESAKTKKTENGDGTVTVVTETTLCDGTKKVQSRTYTPTSSGTGTTSTGSGTMTTNTGATEGNGFPTSSFNLGTIFQGLFAAMQGLGATSPGNGTTSAQTQDGPTATVRREHEATRSKQRANAIGNCVAFFEDAKMCSQPEGASTALTEDR